MNKMFLMATLVGLLASACNRQEPADPLPPAVETATSAADSTKVKVSADPASTSVDAGTGEVAQGADDKRVDAAIDRVLGDHRKYRVVVDAYQKAVAAGDQLAVAKLVRYPLEVTIDGSKKSVRDAAGFVQHYEQIITPAIARVIEAQQYSELMVNQQGVMFGTGETWINGTCKPGSADCSEFEVKVITIQTTDPD